MLRPWPIVAGLLLLLPLSEVTARMWDILAEITTIQAAIDTAASGDTVSVAAGIYHERLTLLNKSLTLRGTSGRDSTFLSGAGFPADGISLKAGGGSTL